MRHGVLVATGRLGTDLDIPTGLLCARQSASNLPSRIREAARSLDHVEDLLKLNVFLASPPSSVEQHVMANGARGLLVEVFGRHEERARSVIGVAALPLDSPEVAAVIAIRASSEASDTPRQD